MGPLDRLLGENLPLEDEIEALPTEPSKGPEVPTTPVRALRLDLAPPAAAAPVGAKFSAPL